MIWQAVAHLEWWEYLLALVAALFVALPVCSALERRDERRDAEDAAAYAEFMRVRR